MFFSFCQFQVRICQRLLSSRIITGVKRIASTETKKFPFFTKQRFLYTKRSDMAEKVTMVIDCDAGMDDAVAIMMALRQPNVDVAAITCVLGNVTVDKVAINVLRVLQKCNRLDIPVYVGASSYILGHPKDASHFHGEDGLGDISDPEPPPSRDLLQAEHAVQALIRMARERPNQITLVAIGPLTNVALATRLDPSFTKNLKEMVIMGGNINGKGTGFYCAEFNFGTDPEAAHMVLDSTECPTILVPLETCRAHGLSYEWCQSLKEKDTTRARFMHAVSADSIERCFRTHKLQSHMMADGCAVVVAANRSAISESTHTVCKVELEGKFTRGQVIAHKLNYFTWIPKMSGTDIEVVTKFDMDVLYKMLEDATR